VGVGGVSRGDVGRLDLLALGPVSFANPVAVFSRDTSGVFGQGEPDGIVGGELLRRHRVTFDYPHARMILEPYSAQPAPFEHDMSGLFLGAEAPSYTRLQIVAVNPKTPATEAGLRIGDEIVSIDGKRAPALTLDRARELLRVPGTRRLEIRRGERLVKVQLPIRRLV
jgi:membrane-associated protease RseP (regulator of RpoE activity)